jgi:hypothetical protein
VWIAERETAMQKASIWLAVAALTAPVAHAGDDMRPGQWQVTQTMEMAGKTMPPHTLTYCHKASDPQEQALPPGQTLPEGCTAGKMEHSGNTLRWSFSCTGENAMQGTGEMTQYAERFEGVMRMKTQAGEMVTRMQGKRLGDC